MTGAGWSLAGAGIALVNHLWQTTAVLALLWLMTCGMKHHRAAIRFRLWAAASAKFVVPFCFLVTLGGWVPFRPALVPVRPQVSALMLRTVQPYQQRSPPPLSPMQRKHGHDETGWIGVLLVGVWALGVLGLVGRWVWSYRAISRLASAAKSCGMVQGLVVKRTAAEIEPGVFGLWRPVLLIPGALLDSLPAAELEAIYAHELCHVRRHDNLLAAVHSLVQALFWFHPGVWWIGARLLEERERACDEEVIAKGNDAEAYAHSLLEVCRLRLAAHTAVMAGMSGGELKERVLRIASATVGAPMGRRQGALLLLVVLGVAGVPLAAGWMHERPVRAQDAAPPPTFEVTSIRPDPKAQGMTSGTEGETWYLRGGTTTILVQDAFDLLHFQVASAPRWLDDERYTVEAKIPPEVVHLPGDERWARTQLMLQSLLAERFHLRYHWTEQVHKGYALVLAGKGSKLVPAKPGEVGGLNIGPGYFTLRAMEMEWLTRNLAGNMDAPVEDRTGLTGKYTVDLHYVDPTEAKPSAADDLSNPDAQVRMFSALEEAGLKLVAEKRPVKILVIDSIERPSPN